MQFQTFAELSTYLDKIPKFQDRGRQAARFELRPFEELCEALGSPQESLEAIQVAGTNGKGSTCRLLASVYHEAGLKAGCYTSPHLFSVTERFRIGKREISEKELLDFFNFHASVLEAHNPTYFELLTAAAFWWFDKEEVDLAIIETGLGGRLDATNIVNPLVSVITSISLDHTDILGDNTADIALEKAGIIKPGVPLVTGNIGREALEVIRRNADEKGARVYGIDSLEPVLETGNVRLALDNGELVIPTGLRAPVQAYNAAATWKVTGILQERFPVSREVFREGITKAEVNFPGTGRFEKLLENREWYFDGAHNAEAVAAMKEMIGTIRPVNRSIVVFSMMKDKVRKKVLEEFLEFKKIFYHTIDSERAADLEEIQRLLPDVKPFPAVKMNIWTFLKENESELVIFAGSFYFYSTVRDWITLYKKNR